MPGNLLFADKQFPKVTGDKESDMNAILNYLYMLQEELRYTMGNLGIENFNQTGLIDLSGITTRELSITVKGVSDDVDTLSGGVDALGESIVTLQGTANSQGASLALLAAYTGQADVVEVEHAWNCTDITKVYKVGTVYYRYDGTEWVVTSVPLTESIAAIQATANSQGSSIDLLAAYTGQADVVEVEHAWNFTDTTKTYKIGTAYYRYNGTEWVADTSIASAALTLAAINGQSEASLNADKINFTGYTTFLTANDVGAGGSTVIDGGRISTGTLYADSLAKVEDDDGYDYIAMQNGFDFRNPDYMNFTESDYTPYSRTVQGLHAISFNGDTVLTAQGLGTTGNAPTYVMGYMRNIQSLTGNISQSGIDIGARYNLRLMGQCFGNSSGGAGAIIYSANPENLVTNETYFQLQVVEAGIYATKYRKESDGSFTQLGSSTILS